jgi:hypothetical protein
VRLCLILSLTKYSKCTTSNKLSTKNNSQHFSWQIIIFSRLISIPIQSKPQPNSNPIPTSYLGTFLHCQNIYDYCMLNNTYLVKDMNLSRVCSAAFDHFDIIRHWALRNILLFQNYSLLVTALYAICRLQIDVFGKNQNLKGKEFPNILLHHKVLVCCDFNETIYIELWLINRLKINFQQKTHFFKRHRKSLKYQAGWLMIHSTQSPALAGLKNLSKLSKRKRKKTAWPSFWPEPP